MLVMLLLLIMVYIVYNAAANLTYFACLKLYVIYTQTSSTSYPSVAAKVIAMAEESGERARSSV